MLTPKMYAQRIDAAYSTVMSWLQRDLIPGAQKQELPSGGWYYVIPEDAPKPELKPGPKPKTEKSANGDDQEAAPKRRASNRSAAKKALKKMRQGGAAK